MAIVSRRIGKRYLDYTCGGDFSFRMPSLPSSPSPSFLPVYREGRRGGVMRERMIKKEEPYPCHPLKSVKSVIVKWNTGAFFQYDLKQGRSNA
jgi:hypothetical protein